MKRILTLIAAVLLALGVFAGCVSIDLTIRNTPAEVSPTPSPKELTRGVVEGNVYTNKSAELKFTAPEGWVYYTDEAIGAIVGTGSGASDGTNTCDMIAIEAETKTSVLVAYQKLSEKEKLYDEKQLIESIKNEMGKDQYHNVVFGDYPDYKIGPNTFKAMTVYYTDRGMIQYYYIRKAGGYVLSIMVTISSGSSYDVGSVMTNFSAPEDTCAEELKRGTFSGYVYSSDYSGITFTLPENWVYRTDGELSYWNSLNADEFAKPGSFYSGEALRQSSLYDMAARDIISSTNISISYENLAMSSEGVGITMEQYIDNVRELSAPDGVEFVDVYDTVLCGNKYKTLTMITAEKDLVQYCYFRRIDKYMIIILVSVFGDDDISNVTACFS